MKLQSLALTAISIIFFASTLAAQTKPSALDTYLGDGKTIIVAKCLRVGPVNILLRADVDVEVIHVVKGHETRQTMTVNSQFGMAEGKYYLLSTKHEADDNGHYFRIETRDSAIEISSADEAQELIALSPRIVVLRTMNLRIHRLESEIRALSYELDALAKSRKEN